ncbi:MAG TPA: carboxypeptidase regulatory-like domain-containing protein [Terracidiphilus sp.]|jgi:plastocyanin
MRPRGWILLCSLAAIAGGLNAQAITGTILIKRKLTKPSVTASVSVYQRGTVVDLGKDGDTDPRHTDPLVAERARVVVYLEGPVAAAAPKTAPQTAQTVQTVQIEQLNRRFVPDLAIVPAGSTVSFPNMDPIFHNIYSLSKPKSFDLGAYDKGESRTVKFPKPGIIEIYCHLHPNMQATVVVTPNRWYAQPDRTGQYRIPDVPPGQYTLVAWHKTAGFFRKTVVVADGHDTKADFFIPLDVEPDSAAEAREAGKSAGSM